MSRTQFIQHFNGGVAGFPANALKVRAFLLQGLGLLEGGRGIDMRRNARRPNDVTELLPWYAAGSLSCGDAQAVEQALAADAALVARLEAIRSELVETVRANESLGGPSARAHARLFAAIAAEGRSGPPGGGSRRPFRMGLVALVGSIAAAIAWLLVRRTRTPAS
jgi:anti-sigma-K factor RskA